MAQYSDHFGSYTAGTQPTGWTDQWGTSGTRYKESDTTSGASSDSILRFSGGSDTRQAFTLDSVDGDANRDNVEILAKVRFSAASSSHFMNFLHGRVSGASTTETSYHCAFHSGAENRLAIRKYDSGAAADLATKNFGTNFTDGKWYIIRFRINGTSLKAKLWRETRPEPSTWDIETTDSAVSGVGAAGVGSFESTNNKDFDYVVVATNGDTATLPTGTGAIRVTQVSAETLLTDTSPEVRVTQVSAETLLSEANPEVRVTQVSIEVLIAEAPAVPTNVVTILRQLTLTSNTATVILIVHTNVGAILQQLTLTSNTATVSLAITIFTFAPSLTTSMSQTPRILTLKFGDGYEQAMYDGINPEPNRWELKFINISTSEAVSIINFFTSNNTATVPFDWTSPNNVAGKYKCRDWKRTYDGFAHNNINCTFEEVFWG